MRRILPWSLLIAFTSLAMNGVAESVFAQSTSPRGPDQAPDAGASIGSAVNRFAEKHGVWLAVAVGRGVSSLNCNTCASATAYASSVGATLGIHVSPQFLLGVDAFGSVDALGVNADRVVRGTYVVVRGYRTPTSRVFLQAGAGVAGYQTQSGEVSALTHSPSIAFTTGYDWRFNHIAITPSLTAIGSMGGRLTSGETGAVITDRARLGSLRATVSFSLFR